MKKLVDSVLMPSEDDDFTTVGKRGKPLRVKPEKPIVAQEDHSEQTKDVDNIHHPDFAAPTTPFDVLLKTWDGTLFWFSLPLLACYSPYFATIDLGHTPTTRWSQSQIGMYPPSHYTFRWVRPYLAYSLALLHPTST